ncbi:MAG: heavy-metal-associated domain-containing protein [Thermodesulfobacteriota bacterium]
MREERIKVEGMSCQHCVSSVREALEALKGISGVRVNLETGQVDFLRSEGVSVEQVREAVERAGYSVAD